jgi:hypothetical protein
MLQTLRPDGDGKHDPDGATLTAVCLLLCHATRSGKREQAQLLTSCLGANISYLDDLGLFRQQDAPIQKPIPDRATSGTARALEVCVAQIRHRNDQDLQDRWLRWVTDEMCRRLAWAHLVRCSVFPSNRARAPLTDLPQTCNYLSAAFLRKASLQDPQAHDLQLPCEDTMWEAESASAWSTCFPWSYNPPPRQLPFRATLRGLLNQTIDLKHVSRFGRLVCAARIHFELCSRARAIQDQGEPLQQSRVEPTPLVDGDSGQMLKLAADLAASFDL